MNSSLSSMMTSFTTILIVIFATLLVSSSTNTIVDALKVGDNICVNGYVMDMFCINRGTFLDAPDIVTLQDPQLHSFHCLIDVPSCVDSEFNVLLNPVNSDSLYRRGFVLDETSKASAITLAKSVGSCEECDNGTNDVSRRTGLRIVMNATITDLKSDNADDPPVITVHNMEESADFDSSSSMSACETYYQMEDITTSSSLNGIIVEQPANGGRTTFMKLTLVHGSLMMIGWGLLLPAGAIIARFLKHRPNGLWFKIHRSIQTFGLLVVLIGFIIAVTQFNVFTDVGLTNYMHGICGVVVMILGLLQPINAVLRPHAPEGGVGAEKTTARIVWEYYHKGSGWLAVLLAIPTIVLGTKSLPVVQDTQTYQIAYGAGCWGCLLVLIAYIFFDKKTYVKEEAEDAAEEVAALKKDDAVVVAEQAEPVEQEA